MARSGRGGSLRHSTEPLVLRDDCFSELPTQQRLYDSGQCPGHLDAQYIAAAVGYRLQAVPADHPHPESLGLPCEHLVRFERGHGPDPRRLTRLLDPGRAAHPQWAVIESFDAGHGGRHGRPGLHVDGERPHLLHRSIDDQFVSDCHGGTVPNGTSPMLGLFPMTSPRDELTRRLVMEVAIHGLGDRSLRDLAAAVGTSHRMLLYHFGSRDGMVTAVVEMVEADQRAVLADL